MTTKRNIAGLPDGAYIQKNPRGEYVFFAYRFQAADGRIKQERDYIGTVQEGRFVPNAFYETCHPVASRRDPRRWKDPDQKARAEKEEATSERSAPEVRRRSAAAPARVVGLTAFMTALLQSARVFEDLAKACDREAVIRAANRGMLTTLASWPEPVVSEPEHLILLGDGETDLAALDPEIDWPAYVMERAARFEPDRLMAFDFAIFESRVKGVPSVNMLLLATEGGQPVGCWPIEGDEAAFFKAFRALHQRGREADMDIALITTRRLSDDALVALAKDKIQFLAANFEDDPRIQAFIARRLTDFHSASNFLRHRNCYGLKTELPIQSGSRATRLKAYVYRDPLRELADQQTPLFVGVPGCFAFAGTLNLTLEEVLNQQATLVNASLNFENSGESSPSLSALIALIALTVVATLQARLLSAALKEGGRNGHAAPAGISASGIFRTLQLIVMSRDAEGRPQLHNVTDEARALVKRLGLEGLFDDPENVAELLLQKSRRPAAKQEIRVPVQGTLF